MQGVLLVLGVVLVIGLALTGMYVGWRGRAARQREAVGALPVPPADPGAPVLPPAAGLYIGSTLAPHWQDRIAVGDLGFRADAVLTAYPEGIVLERIGCEPVWIAVDRIIDLRTESRLAGKVMPGGGLLVVRWLLDDPDGGTTEIDSGFRADDKEIYPDWVALSPSTAPTTPDPTSNTPDEEGTHRE